MAKYLAKVEFEVQADTRNQAQQRIVRMFDGLSANGLLDEDVEFKEVLGVSLKDEEKT